MLPHLNQSASSRKTASSFNPGHRKAKAPRDPALYSPPSQDLRNEAQLQASQWVQDGEYGRIYAELRRNVTEQQNAMSKEVVQAVIDKMRRDQDEVLQRFQKRKWTEILKLHALISKPEYKKIPLYGHNRALYETFYRSVPNIYVTRPRFIGIMRTLYGKEATRCDQMGDVRLIKQLGRLYHCFEKLNVTATPTAGGDNRAELNWRLVLCALKLLREPLKPFIEHLKWAFIVFSSEGYIEVSDRSTIHKDEMYEVLAFCAGSASSRRIILDKVADAEKRLPPGVLFKARVTYHAFCLLLDQTPIQALLEMATNHTCYFIELANPVVRDHIFEIGQQIENAEKCRKFIEQFRNRHLLKSWNSWLELVDLRQRARNTVKAAFMNLVYNKRVYAFSTWMRFTMCTVAAIEIQRTIRGYFGRKEGNYRFKKLNSVISIQRLYRGRNFFGKYLKKMRLFSKKAIMIQRVYRGRLGRIVARKRLLEYFRAEMAKIQKGRQAIEDRIQNRAAKQLQRVIRAYVVRLKEAAEIKRLQEEAEAEEQMQRMLMEAEKEKKVYEHGVTSFYDKLREETEANKARSLIDNKEKSKVSHLRRQRQWEQWRAEKKRQKEAKEAEERKHQEEWNVIWSKKIEERAIRCRGYTIQILSKASTKDERRDLAAIQAKIKQRAKEIQAGYKSSGLSVEKSLINDRAKDEIVKEEMEDERERVRQEWRLAEAQYRKDLESSRAEERAAELEAEAAEQVRSATKIQSGYRLFVARKQLRDKIRRSFVKEFNPETGLALYRNLMTGEESDKKPLSLGSEDLELQDKWCSMKDPSGQSYYFNAKTIVQSWTLPPNCVLCYDCQTKFCQIYCQQHDLTYCHDCYQKHYAEDNSISFGMSQLDGALDQAQYLLQTLRQRTAYY